MAKVAKKHMSKEEQKYWNELYEYVRKNIMGYDENQSLSRTMVLRLKGLSTNKFIANNNINDTANYSYQVILNTFKFCMPSIQKALRNNSFRDEDHKFNYILKIVESNLNNVYMKMRDVEKTKEEIVSIDISNTSEYVNTFKKKSKKTNNKLDELW